MVIEMTGGVDGVRDNDLLDSALNALFQTFDGKELYPALLSKVAVMCRSIILNHSFVDGNKRTGIHFTLIFLELKGIELQYSQNELIELGFGVAAGQLSSDDILKWLVEHAK